MFELIKLFKKWRKIHQEYDSVSTKDINEHHFKMATMIKHHYSILESMELDKIMNLRKLDPQFGLNAYEFYSEFYRRQWKIVHPGTLYGQCIHSLLKVYKINGVIESVVSRYEDDCVDSIYMYPAMDRLDYLVLVTCNKANLFYYPRYEGVYLHYGTAQEKVPSRLTLSYSRSGILNLGVLHSVKRRIGHGSILLESLENLLHLFEESIHAQNKALYYEYYPDPNDRRIDFDHFLKTFDAYKFKKRIVGRVGQTDNVDIEDVRAFYAKNGFLQDNEIYKQY
ncbi:hypothetical protein [Paenibacillus nuruki]|uniref:hypothetical protein n=1 Tax=Paenibacillus nuruki TaxID=1886670 RepID=UPI0015863F5F|nr:hypothetical protein [Paenibacillus nuruki]